MTDLSKLAFIDTETTGLDPERNPIWEIAVIVDDVEHCWRVRTPLMRIVPDSEYAPIGPYASQWVYDNTAFGTFVHDQRDALHPADSIQRFADLVEGRHLVGAVPSFDEERLRRLYLRYVKPRATRFPWHYHLIDVEALALGYLSRVSQEPGASAAFRAALQSGVLDLPWKSDDLSRLINVEPPTKEERHSALADARWARELYLAVTE